MTVSCPPKSSCHPFDINWMQSIRDINEEMFENLLDLLHQDLAEDTRAKREDFEAHNSNG